MKSNNCVAETLASIGKGAAGASIIALFAYASFYTELTDIRDHLRQQFNIQTQPDPNDEIIRYIVPAPPSCVFHGSFRQCAA